MKSSQFFLRVAIVLSILLMGTVFPFSSASAYNEGPNNPGMGENVSGTGSEPWVNPGEITSPGAPYATVTVYQGHRYTNYLRGSQYGFTLPADALITGIQVDINRMSSAHNPNIVDTVVRLVKGGSIVGDNKADTVATWPTTLTVATYGGPTDLWGTTWTAAEVNALDFGVVLAANRDNNGIKARTANVDSMQITVYYGAVATTAIECGDGTPIVYGDSLTCVATITGNAGALTPTGTVDWTSDGSGTFQPNPCTLSGANGVASCSAIYTPEAVGSGVHLLTASYSGDASFGSSQASQPITVLTRPVTVTADPQVKTYGQADPLLTYQITSGSLVFGDTFSGSLSRAPGEAVGSYAILQGTLALSDNYDLTFVGSTLTIQKVAITVTADAVSKMYRQPDPALTYQVTAGALLPGDAFSGSLSRVPGENPGVYPILQGSLSLPDYYAITFVGADFTIISSGLMLPLVYR